MSRPVIVPTSKSTSKDSGAPVLNMKGLWHPFALGETGREPVPNDMILGENEGGYHPRTLLLTGPNMGGKSTLLRATCLAVIMAQVLILLHFTSFFFSLGISDEQLLFLNYVDVNFQAFDTKETIASTHIC